LCVCVCVSLVPPQPGSPGQDPESCKMVVGVVVVFTELVLKN